MKKYILLFSLVISVIFTGCGGGGSSSSNNSGSQGTQSQTYTIGNTKHYALLGPLENATVNVFAFTDLENPIATTTTGENGSFEISFIDSYYPYDNFVLVSISEGTDIDEMDTGKRNSDSISNKGTFYAIVDNDAINNDSARVVNGTPIEDFIKITPLTDYIYSRVLKKYNGDLSSINFLNTSDYTILKNELDAFAKEIIEDINNDGEVDYNDVLSFIPYKDKTKIKIPWSSIHNNIIKPIHRGETFKNRLFFTESLDSILNSEIEDNTIIANDTKIEKTEVSENLIKNIKIENSTLIETTLEKRDSGNLVGKTELNVNNSKAQIDFPISTTELFDKSSKELSDSTSLNIKVEKEEDGKHIVTIPKELINSWTESEATITINGEPIDVEIIDDDPVIGWYFPEGEFDSSTYTGDFVRPFNFKNLTPIYSRVDEKTPFANIKSSLNPENSIDSSTSIWNELVNSVTLKYQILYYDNLYDEEEQIRDIKIKTQLQEIDLISNDYYKSKNKEFTVNIPKGDYGRTLYYIIGPDNYITVDVETNKIIASSLSELVDKNFFESIYKPECSKDSEGYTSCKDTQTLEEFFEKLGYFSWTENISTYLDRLLTGLDRDLEFFPYIHINDTETEEEYKSSIFKSKKVIKYHNADIKLTSNFTNKTFIDGETIDIKWEASDWNGEKVYIAIECKNDSSDHWWLIDAVNHIDEEENSYKWEIGDFSENSSVWNNLNHDECRIEVARNRFHYDSDKSGYFKIIETNSSDIESIEIEGPSTVNENTSTGYDYNLIATYTDGTKKELSPFWSDTSSYVKINQNGGIQTTSVSSDKTFTINAKYNGTTYTKTVTLKNKTESKTLSSIRINGSSSVNENSSATYTIRAYYSDGSYSTKTSGISWSENSSYASISSSGRLSTSSVSSDKTVTITANYGGKSSTKRVTIKNKVSVTYSWSTGTWGSCNNGTQTRTVVCKSSTGSTVNDSYCSSVSKPSSSQSCSINKPTISINDIYYSTSTSKGVSVNFKTTSESSSYSIQMKYYYLVGSFKADLHTINRTHTNNSGMIYFTSSLTSYKNYKIELSITDENGTSSTTGNFYTTR